VICPVSAAAAAVRGLARKVRPPLPCRRFEVAVAGADGILPGWSWSPFMAMHIEQPASAPLSAPASCNILSRPSTSACFLTSCEPAPPSRASLARPSYLSEALPQGAEVRDTPVGCSLPMKTTSTFFPSNCLSGLQSHVGQALVQKPLSGWHLPHSPDRARGR